MADIKSLMKKVKLIELKTRKEVDNLFAGSFYSKFKGQGIDFLEVRNYINGDDIRNIDWNVSARYQDLYVREYQEEKELNLIIAVDVSKSMLYGSDFNLKRDIVAEIVAILGFSAIKNNNKVGLLLFGENVKKFIPADKGHKHMMLILREILEDFDSNNTDIEAPIKFLNNVLNRKSIVIFISDFLFDMPVELKKRFGVLGAKHDLMAIKIGDTRETEIIKSGIVRFKDIESGENFYINTNSKKTRKKFNEISNEYSKNVLDFFKKSAIRHIEINTDGNYIKELLTLFR